MSYKHNLPDVGKIDIIITPSGEAVRRTVAMFKYWDGKRLVYRDVPVDRQIKR